MRLELYRWQRACLEAWECQGRRGIARVVTGAGKTVLALNAVDRWLKAHPEGVVKVVVPTIPLAHQWARALRHHLEGPALNPGFYGGGKRDPEALQVIIYIVNSAREALAGHARRALSLGKPLLLICDECHHYQSAQNRRIFDFLTPEVLASAQYACLGLSATPFGAEDEGVLLRALGPVIYEYGFAAAVREGVVSSFTVCEVGVSFLPQEREEYARLSYEIAKLRRALTHAHPELEGMDGDRFIRTVARFARAAGMDSDDPAALLLKLSYARKEVSTLARSRVECGLALLERLSPSDRVLIFSERIAQAEAMAAGIRRRLGDICALYHSRMPREARARCMEDFRENRVSVLVSCRCLDEGIDVPDANVGIVLSSAAVPRQRIQRMGRLIRCAPDKDAACLYYLYVGEAADDPVFLPGLERCESFGLKYLPLERDFVNELYEYAANDLLRRARERHWSPERLRELRRCLNQGAVRADYLLPGTALSRRLERAENARERNYLRTMGAMSRAFHGDRDQGGVCDESDL